MSRPRLRTMMLVPIIITMTVAFVTFGVYLDQIEADNRLTDIDDELSRAERSFEQQLQLTDVPDRPETGGPPEGVGQDGELPAENPQNEAQPPTQLLVGSNGQILADIAPTGAFPKQAITDIATRSGLSTLEDGSYRVLVTPQPDGTVQITALSLAQFDAAAANFRRTLILGGLVILVLAAVAVWVLSDLLVRPVTQMAATATRIADGELDTEIANTGASQEISELGSDLGRMMTQLRTVIAEREESAAAATQARDNMRRFLADVSHELRTPLTALKGYSDLYAGNMLEEPGALDRAMGRIGDESERLARLVTDMLALAREVPSGEPAEPFNPCETVRSVVDDLQAAYPELAVTLAMDPNNDRTVFGRADGLHQAILNVGANACQHTEPEEGVHFDIDFAETSIRIKVIDHGPGIEPSEADNIFLPFYRHQTSRIRSDRRGGAGLGLAITQQIIERLDGTISVANTPRGGATFTITVPLVDSLTAT